MHRRDFLFRTAAAALGASSRAFAGSTLTHKERVDRALAGRDVDRPPFTFWHHFGLKTPEAHAARTLDFHRRYRTDIVKVMSDFPYPKPDGEWYQLKPVENPFPQQIRALELIRDGLNGDAQFIETVFNPWNVAEKLSSPEELARMKTESPQRVLDALDAITKSEISHVKRALATGASGILLSVANANRKELAPEDYERFSAPFDRRLTEAMSGAKLSVLHLHVEPEYLGQFHDFPAPILNYSVVVSGIPIADVRRQYRQVIMGGIDEVNFRTLSPQDLRRQWESAQREAGSRFILAPGCSVPNDSSDEELARLTQVVGA